MVKGTSSRPRTQSGQQSLQSGEQRGAFSYENRVLLVLCLTFGFVFFDRNAVNFLAPFIAQDLSLSNTQIGLLASGLSLTWALAGYVFGKLCDSIGRHRLILVCSIVAFSLCSFLSGLAGSFALLLSARVLMGLAEGPVLPISQVIMVQASSPNRRGFNMGAMQQFGANVLGTFLAPVALVALAVHFNWRRAFFIAGVPGLLCALMVWSTVRDPVLCRTEEREIVALRLREILRYRNIPLCIVLSGLMIAMAVLAWVFFPLYFVRVRNMAPETMSILMSILGLSAVISCLIVPGLSDKYGRKPVMLVTTLAALLMPFAVLFVTHSTGFLAILLFIGFAASSLAPLAMATIPAETIGGARVAAVVGLVNGSGEMIGGVVAPAIGGVLGDRYGLTAPILFQAACIVASLILIQLLRETAPGKCQDEHQELLRKRASGASESEIGKV